MTRDKLRRLMKKKAAEPPRSRRMAKRFLKGDSAPTPTRKKDKAARLGMMR